MATTQTPAKSVPAAPAVRAVKAPVNIGDRIKTTLTAAVLRNKITVDDLSDLEQHIKKLASVLV